MDGGQSDATTESIFSNGGYGVGDGHGGHVSAIRESIVSDTGY